MMSKIKASSRKVPPVLCDYSTSIHGTRYLNLAQVFPQSLCRHKCICVWLCVCVGRQGER